jgi:hypothetical protein
MVLGEVGERPIEHQLYALPVRAHLKSRTNRMSAFTNVELGADPLKPTTALSDIVCLQ